MLMSPVEILLTFLKGLTSVAVSLVFAIPLLVVVGVIVLLALKILKGGNGAKATERSAEEARIIQDVYHGLEKMEKRIEALETILLEKGMKE